MVLGGKVDIFDREWGGNSEIKTCSVPIKLIKV